MNNTSVSLKTLAICGLFVLVIISKSGVVWYAILILCLSYLMTLLFRKNNSPGSSNSTLFFLTVIFYIIISAFLLGIIMMVASRCNYAVTLRESDILHINKTRSLSRAIYIFFLIVIFAVLYFGKRFASGKRYILVSIAILPAVLLVSYFSQGLFLVVLTQN